MNARTLPEYLEPLTPLAQRIGEEDACKDVPLFATWLESASQDRQPSEYFGPISTLELVRDYWLNPRADKDGVHAASIEIRRRFLADEHEYVLTLARRAMLP